MHLLLLPWKRYACFSGRATRNEFWMFVFASIGIVIMLAYFEVYSGITPPGTPSRLPPLFILGAIIPGWAVTVRRLHDTNRSGACIFYYLVPVIGTIMLLIYLSDNSYKKESRYGPCP